MTLINCTSIDANQTLNPAGYVVTDSSDAFNFGTGDFTLECWLYPIQFGNIWTGFLTTMEVNSTIFPSRAGVAMGSCQGSSSLTFGINASSASAFNDNCSNANLALGTVSDWQHIALTRSSGTVRMFINGLKVGSDITDSRNVNTNSKRLGIGHYYAFNNSNANPLVDWMYKGYIDEVRVSNIARYTSDFSTDNTPFVSDSNTVFLCHFDDVDYSTPGIVRFLDSGPNNIGVSGVCQTDLSSSQKKFGNYSLGLALTAPQFTPPATPSVTPTITPTLTPTLTPTVTPTVTVTPSATPILFNCDKKILKLYIPNSTISPGGTRASSIQLRIGGGTCCSRSNIRDIIIPALPPEPPPPTPDVCLEPGTDLYGYTAIVSYDPANCAAGHSCNRAIFDFYINDILIGQANLNNSGDGGYREGVFTINNHIIANALTELKLVCALASGCHNGVGRVVLKNPSNNIVLAICMPNDIVVAGSFICSVV